MHSYLMPRCDSQAIVNCSSFCSHLGPVHKSLRPRAWTATSCGPVNIRGSPCRKSVSVMLDLSAFQFLECDWQRRVLHLRAQLLIQLSATVELVQQFMEMSSMFNCFIKYLASRAPINAPISSSHDNENHLSGGTPAFSINSTTVASLS